MANISNVKAREILDSKGNPTMEIDVVLDNGVLGRATVPSGASTGSREAVELRDHDDKRFHGKGVQKVVNSVIREIAPEIAGFDVLGQRKIDQTLIALDGTANKSRRGCCGECRTDEERRALQDGTDCKI